MKFTLPTLIALMAVIPVFSVEVAEPLTIVLVTAWSEGIIAGVDVASIDHKIPVDDQLYREIYAFTPQQPAIGANFDFEGGVLGDKHYGCFIKVIKDPGVPIVHIVFEGDVEDFKLRANKHDEAFSIEWPLIEQKVR